MPAIDFSHDKMPKGPGYVSCSLCTRIPQAANMFSAVKVAHVDLNSEFLVTGKNPNKQLFNPPLLLSFPNCNPEKNHFFLILK